MNKYIEPKYYQNSFHCPLCGVFSNQLWGNAFGSFNLQYLQISGSNFSYCAHCKGFCYWRGNMLVFPTSGTAPLPSEDLPDEVKEIYLEARSIANASPRGATALLRLAIQKLCKALGEKGENINEDIASLVKKGLPEKLQKAMDSVRVVGNQAVHPGQIDFEDDSDVATKLFVFINVICENQITQSKMIDQFYTDIIPDGAKQAIQKRDSPKS